MSWVSVGVQAAKLVGTGIKAGADSVTDCGKECRTLCKTRTGIIFSGRKDCKNICKSNCIQRLTPEELKIEQEEAEKERKRTNTIYAIAGFVFLIALGISLYYVFKKK